MCAISIDGETISTDLQRTSRRSHRVILENAVAVSVHKDGRRPTARVQKGGRAKKKDRFGSVSPLEGADKVRRDSKQLQLGILLAARTEDSARRPSAGEEVRRR